MPVELAPYTTLRLGGPADALEEARTEAEVLEALRSPTPPALVLAGGSNVVISDAGVRGTVLRIATRGVRRTGHRLVAQAGEPWEGFVDACVADGLAGVECLAGIPGTVGATPIQNVGAYGQEVADTVAWVRALDRDTGEVAELPAAECGFAYRASRFKGTARWVVLAVAFDLEPARLGRPVRYAELARRLGVDLGEAAPPAAVRDAVLDLRRGKGMVVDPVDPDSVSAGSFFTNPILELDAFEALSHAAGADDPPPGWPEPDGRIKTSAAWLIGRAGFRRGYGEGAVGISAKHTLALVNRGGATTAQLVALAREIAGGVQRAFGVALRPEPVFVGHTW